MGAHSGLAALEARVGGDLAALNHPPRSWPAERRAAGGQLLLDVAVIGAGMCGLAAGFGLLRQGIGNIAIFDRAPAGREGPWITYARMRTLRSPKHLTGPDLGIPSLTFRAGGEAQRGAQGWERLGKIAKEDWMAYLGWLRRVARLPVENGVELVALEPAEGALRLVLDGAAGRSERFARKVVLATGRDGAGGVKWPGFVDPALRPDLAAHSREDIDFRRLAGKRIAVLGGGASAFDNAAAALEAGAASVEILIRRPTIPQVNKSKGIVFAGFQSGFAHLDEATRWRILVYMGDLASPPPRETVMRVMAHPDASVRLGTRIRKAARHDGRVRLHLAEQAPPLDCDFLILGTGFAVDLARQPELAALAPHAALWRDRYEPPEALRREELLDAPYLGPHFELVERVPGACPALRHVHLFNHGATASHGALAGDIPGLGTGVGRLVEGIVLDLFREDLPQHLEALTAFEEPELA